MHQPGPARRPPAGCHVQCTGVSSFQQELLAKQWPNLRWIPKNQPGLHKDTQLLLVAQKNVLKTEKLLCALSSAVPIFSVGRFERDSERLPLDQLHTLQDDEAEKLAGTASLAERRKWHEAGGRLAHWKVLLLLRDQEQRKSYANILRSAGAHVYDWEESTLRDQLQRFDENFPNVNYIFSEPKRANPAHVRDILQIKANITYSFFYISECIMKPLIPSSSAFRLSIGSIRLLHLQYQRHARKHREKIATESSLDSSRSLDSSIVMAPNLDTRPVTSLKRLNSSPADRSIDNPKKKVHLEIDKIADSATSLVRRSSSLHEHRCSQSSAEDENELTEIVKLADDLGARRRMLLYRADIGQQPSYQCDRAKDLVFQPMEPYFNKAYDDTSETGGGNAHSQGEYDYWHWVVFSDCMRAAFTSTSDRLPTKSFIRGLLIDGLLAEGKYHNDITRFHAHRLLLEWATFTFPPTGEHPGIIKMYLGAMCQQPTTSVMNQDAPWDLLSTVLDKVATGGNGKSGPSLLLDWFAKVSGIHFKNCFQRSKLYESLISRVMWSRNEAITVSSRVQKLLEFFVRCTLEGSILNVKRLSSLVAMVAQCIASKDNEMESNRAKIEFADALLNRISSFKIPADYYRKKLLPLLRPNWLRLLVTQRNLMIHQGEVPEDDIVNLRQLIESMKNFTFKKTTVEEVNLPSNGRIFRMIHSNSTKRSHETELLKPNRRNQYGETRVHVACKRGDSEKLVQLLSCPEVEINVKDFSGWTPLHEAASHGHTKCVEYLLDFNKETVDLTARDNPDGITPIEDAIIMNQYDTARLMLKKVKSDARFPSLNSLLTSQRVHFVDDPAMKKLLQKYKVDFSSSRCSVLRELTCDEDFLLLHHMLGYYIAEFSLHFVHQEIKRKPQVVGKYASHELNFNHFNEIDASDYTPYRNENVRAKDIRSHNELKTFASIPQLTAIVMYLIKN